MKKHVPFGIALLVTFGAFAQTSPISTSIVLPKINSAVAKKAVYRNNQKCIVDSPMAPFAANNKGSKQKASANHNKSITYTNTVIGTTIYDLQTNSSICNRIVLNVDGTIGATWTMSHDNSALPSNDRGTGYNYFDGTSWGTEPSTRLESIRCGWPNLGVTSTGGEVVVSHEATGGTGNLHVLTRPVKGTGTWRDTTLNYPDTWARMAVGGANGKTIHIISQTSGAQSSGSGTANPPYHGQDGAISYSRSLDGGITWDKVRSIIPEIDSSHYLGFGGDNYAIDAKGDTIAIVAGGMDVDVVLLKSIDNGTTWTKTIVNQFPIPMFDGATMTTDTNNDGTADTLVTNDGSLTVLLDLQGNAHVWFGAMRVVCDVPGTAANQGLSYFPGTDGMCYWNESMVGNPAVVIANAMDIDNDGTLNVADWGTYYSGFTSMPSAGISADGKIYLSYSSIFEGDADGGAPAVGKSYRHTYVMRSDDGGVTWCEPQDITDAPGPNYQGYIEGVFGAMAKRVDNFVHLIYQKDAAPGHGLSGDPQGSTDAQSGASDIVYVRLNVDEVACGANFGINEKNGSITQLDVYPNPANDIATLTFTANKKGKAMIKVYNNIGQQVNEFSKDLSSEGTTQLDMNVANYKPGIYFINTSIGSQTISRKLIVN